MADDEVIHSQFSTLDSKEESLFIISIFFILPIATSISGKVLFTLFRQRNNVRKKYRLPIKFAIVSAFCSLLVYMTIVFFCNDLVIHWNYDQHHLFVSTADSIFQLFAAFSKITFYISFTYYALILFDDYQSKSRKYLIIWMFITCLMYFSVVLIYLIIDIKNYSPNEIGITSPHNIHITMFLGYHENNSNEYIFVILSFIIIIIDVLYFLILSYFYIRRLREINNENSPVKGVVLLFYSSLILWICLLIIAVQSSLKWFSIIGLLSDDICLFFLFTGQSSYHFWCKRLDMFCFRFVFRSKRYQSVGQVTDIDINTETAVTTDN